MPIFPSGQAQTVIANANLTDAKLVAPGIGWALKDAEVDNGYLWWTEDGGGHWQNITPHTQRIESIVSVYFRDSRVGWALLAGPRVGNTYQFDLASTTSAGSSWSIHRILVVRGGSLPIDGASGSVFFVDSLHGWVDLAPWTGMPHSGQPDSHLLKTSNGGITWEEGKDPDDGLALTLLDENTALIAGEDSNGVSITRNGARTWDRLSFPVPEEFSKWIDPRSYPHVSTPIFEDARHGYETVVYNAAGLSLRSAAVLFETLDGGTNWKARAILSDLQGNLDPPFSSTVTDSTWLIARRPEGGLPVLTALHKGDQVRGISEPSAGYQSEIELSFIDPLRGWVLVKGALLATQDGGVTWKAISPR